MLRVERIWLMDVERQLNHHKDSVYRQLVRTCHRREDAEDALVETMIAAFQNAGKLDHPQAMRSWLGTVANRVCHHIQRRDDLRQALSLDQIAEPMIPETAELAIEQEELKSCMQLALDSLAPDMRRAYELCELEDFSIAEAARREMVSEAALKSRLYRARKHLRISLDRFLCLSNESIKE
ncbi:MAG: RNA polymerase sigma factor [Fimbriimonadaceae bacterium]|nr:RNA polymerase sigma factor [Fimbriimonadaceae bacterium]